LALYLRSIIIGFLLAVALASWFAVIKPAPKKINATNDNALTASLKAILPQPHAAFVIGTLIGSRSGLPKSIRDDFARTSTSHITAVSGYNITLIAGIVGSVLAYFMRRSYAFWATVIVLIFFLTVTGAQASVVRATIMGLYALVARQFGRLPSPSHGLLLTAGIMVALEPRILAYDIGFQLSFLATAGIFYIVPIIEHWLPRFSKIPVLGETFSMTVSAQIAVLPLLIYYFHSISIVSLPVNLLVLPLIPFIMISGFIAGVFGLVIPILGQLAATVPHLLSYIVLAVIHKAASFRWAAVEYNISIFLVFSLYAIALLLLAWYSKVHDE